MKILPNKIFGLIRLVITGGAVTVASLFALSTIRAVAAEMRGDALLAHLKDSKHSLTSGIIQAQKDNGTAISAKYEVDGEKLSLSVYTAKSGAGNDAEHNVLIELSGDPTGALWAPEIEVFEDKKHLTRSAMQLTLVQVSTVSLLDAVKKAESAQPGIVYSVIPAVSAGNPVFDIQVATADGKSIHLILDGRTGTINK